MDYRKSVMTINHELKITHVAIVFDGAVWVLPEPNRHHNVIRAIYDDNKVGINGPHKEGFLTEDGEYINRKDAFVLAGLNGQLLKRSPFGYNGDELYSEDLW